MQRPHGLRSETARARRVIVEATPLRRPGSDRGLGRYTNAVIAGADLAGYEVRRLTMRDRAGRTAEFRDLAQRQLSLMRGTADVFHATNPYMTAPLPRMRKVATILDLIPLELPGYLQSGVKAKIFFGLAARADAILTLSGFTKERVAERLGVPRERVVVAPLPVAKAFVPRPNEEVQRLQRRLGLRPPYVCALADLRAVDPRKRNNWLPGIAGRLRPRGLELVAAGGGSERWSAGEVHGVGRLSDDELAALYSGATCFVNTSAYEGQGMPMVEAMACGTPVAAMSNTSIPELIDGGGKLVEEEGELSYEPSPGAEERLADACIAIAESDTLRAELVLAARASASRFDLARLAAGLATAYSAPAAEG